jgi:ABC-type transport system involved in multi-copper enzyme maturation permease subunit
VAKLVSKVAGPVAYFWRIFQSNPIILKEFRGRMRNWRGTFNLAVYTAALSFVGLLFYILNGSRYNNYYGNLSTTASSSGSNAIIAPIPTTYASYDQSQTGSWLLLALIITQLVLITFLSPAFTAGTIASEKERQTYDILITTLLRPRDIVLGKLLSAQAYLCLMVVAALPVLSVVFLVGGVSFSQILIGLAVCLITTMMLGSLAIYRSAANRSTNRAFRSAFFMILVFFMVVPGSGFLAEQTVRDSNRNNYYYSTGVVISGTPYTPPEWLQIYTHVSFSFNPALALGESFNRLNSSSKDLFFSTNYYYPNGNRLDGLTLPMPWLTYCVVALLLTGLFFWLAVRLVKPYNPAFKMAGLKKIKPGSR